MGKRPIVVHYHLFKNAGTSVDKILRKNFGARWTEVEGNGGRKLDADDLLVFIRNNPHLHAVSSHTAVVNIPEVEDIEIMPVFFFRHPLDRIRSAYDFECKQDAQTPGAIKAKEGDFEHYMEWRLSTANPWQVANFHAFKLKDFHQFTPAKQLHLFEKRARAALNALPVIGLVEKFDISMQRFEALIQQHFPDFKAFDAHENVTADKSLSVTANVERFAQRVGANVYEKLLENNAIDMALYNVLKQQFTSQTNSAN